MPATDLKKAGIVQGWAAAFPAAFVLGADEYAIEIDTGKCKKGDGTTIWSSLAYLPFPSASITYGATILADPGAVVNTATATQVWAPSTCPTSAFRVGSVFQLDAFGTLGTKATSGFFTMPVKLNGNTVISPQTAQNVTSALGATGGRWRISVEFIIEAVGVSGLVCASSVATGMTSNGGNGTGNSNGAVETIQALAQSIDLSSGISMALMAKMATADPLNQINLSRGSFRLMQY